MGKIWLNASDKGRGKRRYSNTAARLHFDSGIEHPEKALLQAFWPCVYARNAPAYVYARALARAPIEGFLG